jgi:hypothetical protein
MARKSSVRTRSPGKKPGRRAPSIRRAPVRRDFEGGCHCGAIEFTYATAELPRRWSLRACQCGFCRAHGLRAASDPGGEVRFRFIHPEYLRRYRFGLRTADFLVCKECGTCIGAVLLSGRGVQAAINVNALKDPPGGLPKARVVSFDGESAEVRRARRIREWTPVSGPV